MYLCIELQVTFSGQAVFKTTFPSSLTERLFVPLFYKNAGIKNIHVSMTSTKILCLSFSLARTFRLLCH